MHMAKSIARNARAKSPDKPADRRAALDVKFRPPEHVQLVALETLSSYLDMRCPHSAASL